MAAESEERARIKAERQEHFEKFALGEVRGVVEGMMRYNQNRLECVRALPGPSSPPPGEHASAPLACRRRPPARSRLHRQGKGKCLRRDPIPRTSARRHRRRPAPRPPP